jgi:hypothetical protein
MILNWTGNDSHITANKGGKPETSHGPGLVSDGGSFLEMIFVGESSDDGHMWSLTTSAADLPKWDQNAEINGSLMVAGASAPESQWRPAVAFFNDQIHMIYAGRKRRNLWWAWSTPGGPWNNVELPFSGTGIGPQPALAVHTFNQKSLLVLAWAEYIQGTPGSDTTPVVPDQNNIRYAFLPEDSALVTQSWEDGGIAVTGGSLPALADFNGTLFMMVAPPANEGSGPIKISQFTGANWSPLKTFTVPGKHPISSGGGQMAVVNNVLYLVYPGEHGSVLNYAWIDSTGAPGGDIPVNPNNGSTPKTSAPVGVCALRNSLCVGFKGEGHDIYFCMGS